ncbi:Serine-threonine/tyrosine-protein kinase [Theobroma cacao]|nr:Serine-threonine/tyrosine-protein kinase [Theobroma cacao]
MLNGSISIAFNGLRSLTIVNISYNQLESPIRHIKAFHEASFDALRNNKGLCGNATGLMRYAPITSNKIGILLLIFTLVGGFFILRQKIQTKKSESREAQQPGDIFTIFGFDGRTLYENIIEATEDFNSNYCIGSGGSRYLCYQLVSYGFCSHSKHLFLVYEFVERGSLRRILSNNEEGAELDWMKRLNVVKGLANALSYMHHDHHHL